MGSGGHETRLRIRQDSEHRPVIPLASVLAYDRCSDNAILVANRRRERRAVGLRSRHVEFDRLSARINAVSRSQEITAINQPSGAAYRHNPARPRIGRGDPVVGLPAYRFGLGALARNRTFSLQSAHVVRNEALDVGAEEVA